MTITEALGAMGYSEQKPGHWLKPIGFQLFSYHEGRNEWANWFRSAPGEGGGEVSCWERKRFSSDEKYYGTYLDQLKNFECFTRSDFYGNGNSQFEVPLEY